MRTAVIVYSGVMTIILLVAIISVITMKSSYSESIAQSLDDSIEYSVKSLQSDRDDIINYASPSNALSTAKRKVNWDNWDTVGDPIDKKEADEKFKQEFIDNLVSNIDSRINKIDINIYGADAEYGLISVKVIAHFDYPFGKEDKVVSKKTIILNKELK